MPAARTYPGVYVDETPSGVHTIVGVATSITAFIGRTRRGPTNEPVTISSFVDFEKTFGGLWLDNALGYAVRDFFLNGGSQAIIVRLYRPDPGNGQAPMSTAAIAFGNFKFTAANEGSWGVYLRVSVDLDNVEPATATSLGVTVADVFNLTVADTSTGITERYTALTVKDGPRRVDKVLQDNSSLLRYDGSPDARELPAAGMDPVSGLEAALAVAKKQLADDVSSGKTAADITADEDDVKTAQNNLGKAQHDALATASDGLWLTAQDFLPASGDLGKQGLYALEQSDLFNILCIPPYRAPTDALDIDVSVVRAAATYCEKRRAMLLVDAPKDWTSVDSARNKFNGTTDDNIVAHSRNAALYFPRLQQPNPLRDNRTETFAASGAVAGVYTRTDTNRGVWKAPAGLDATLVGVPALSVALTDAENGELNRLRINCLRGFPAAGRVVWDPRALRGATSLRTNTSTSPFAARRSTSKRASTAARNGLSSNRTRNPYGRRSGTTSARS